jgi:hypothetical protein
MIVAVSGKIGPKMPLGPSSVVISTYAPEMLRGPPDVAGRATGRRAYSG